jgi:hypothetical protein
VLTDLAAEAGNLEPELTIDIDDEEADLLVIEDDLPQPLPMHRPAPLVRRQEYRQLFTRLRRG